MHDVAPPGRRGSRTRPIGLIILVVVVGVLLARFAMTLLVVSNAGRSPQARVAKVRNDLKVIRTSCAMFREDHGGWPRSLDELFHPPPTSSGQEFRYLEQPLEDPWTGEPYLYRVKNGRVLVMSLGADEAEGGTGFDEDILAEWGDQP